MDWRSWLKFERLIPSATIILAFVAQALELFGIIQLSVGEQIIMLLLAFLAIDALSERLNTIEKLRKEIRIIQNNQTAANNFFSYRDEIPSLSDFLMNAKSIDVTGASLLALATQNRLSLEEKLKQGCKFRLICFNPHAEQLSEMAYALSGAISPIGLSREILISLENLQKIITDNPNLFEVRTYGQSIAHSVVITDGNTLQGKMRVEIYVAGKTGPHRPGFFLKKYESPGWFSVFMDEFEMMWEQSVPLMKLKSKE
jgi:hypothetical protein